jgi:hypothetical protein
VVSPTPQPNHSAPASPDRSVFALCRHLCGDLIGHSARTADLAVRHALIETPRLLYLRGVCRHIRAASFRRAELRRAITGTTSDRTVRMGYDGERRPWIGLCPDWESGAGEGVAG